MHRVLSSLQNPIVKQIIQLQEKSRERKKTGLFVIEGYREISLGIKGNYIPRTILYCPEILGNSDHSVFEQKLESQTEFIEITAEVYNKIAYRGSTEGILAVAETRELDLDQLSLKSAKLLILVAEAPEKPGNIGALLRTADAAGVDAVIIANPKTDMFNPNIIRSSVGCLFTNNIATGTTSEIIAFLKQRKIEIFCAALQASIPYYSCDFRNNTAIVVGTEATGLSSEWLRNSTQNMIIPMEGEIDSMNVSVAAGILIFEAKRQRI